VVIAGIGAEVSLDELTDFIEVFGEPRGASTVITKLVGTICNEAEDVLRHCGSSSDAIRQAQGAVKAMRELTEQFALLLQIDVGKIGTQAGEEDEIEEETDGIATY